MQNFVIYHELKLRIIKRKRVKENKNRIKITVKSVAQINYTLHALIHLTTSNSV